MSDHASIRNLKNYKSISKKRPNEVQRCILDFIPRKKRFEEISTDSHPLFFKGSNIHSDINDKDEKKNENSNHFERIDLSSTNHFEPQKKLNDDDSIPCKDSNISISRKADSSMHIDWESELGKEWYELLRGELKKNYFKKCLEILAIERQTKRVYPPQELLFNAFKCTPISDLKVVILGQDPYHQAGQAMGLCFSVNKGVPLPPSLKNIFKEAGINSNHGNLTHWATQGVFLMNSLFSVVEGQPMSHKNLGWSQFTDAVIDIINENCNGVVFLLWGRPAQKKASRVDLEKHFVLKAGHPSPLSVKLFEGCDHFNKCNKILETAGKRQIDWTLPQ